MENIEVNCGIDWTKQNTEMNDFDKAFCDELYRSMRLMKKEEIEGATEEQGISSQEVK
mgnify:CR=1 FL=1